MQIIEIPLGFMLATWFALLFQGLLYNGLILINQSHALETGVSAWAMLAKKAQGEGETKVGETSSCAQMINKFSCTANGSFWGI